MGNIKVGTIFFAPINDKQKKYFQLVAIDSLMLNSEVIRVFTKSYSLESTPSLDEVINDNVDFYSHCTIKVGIRLKLWEKAGHIDFNKELSDVIFRNTNDIARKADEPMIKVSENWYIWKIGDEKFTKIGPLGNPYKNAEIGLIFNPDNILQRMRLGSYKIAFPD